MRRSAYVIIVATAAACGGPAMDGDDLALRALTDLDPSPDGVEVSLVAGLARTEYLRGKRADVWAYRDGAASEVGGTVPGPLLAVNQGERVTIHFRNELPEATTIHWHGLRVPNASDGTPSSQVPVPPGGTFDYRFVAEDAGTFWYHPHIHGDVQIERGLYGAVVVKGGVEPAVTADRVFVLDDVKLEASGQLSAQTDQLDMMLGRQGNVLLVNGRMAPKLAVKAGARERWRFINSANGRYFNLALPGHTFLVIGWDGGLIPEPYAADTLLIAPGERYEVIVNFAREAGSSTTLETLHYDRGHNIPDPGPLDLLTLRLTSPAEIPPALPTSWGSFAPLPVAVDTPQRSLVLSEEEAGLPEPRFLINGEAYPDVTPLGAREGDVEVWAVKNDAEMDHPFHLHGMFFQVLDRDGVPPEHRGWKDTVNVPQKATLRFAVRYGTPGRWMYHCHILEHAERGMMGELAISAAGP